MSHAILLGDSIFDNASYVPGRPAVIEQLRAWLPKPWRATLLAVDGAVTASVLRQLDHLPNDATHLVISVGGNDALGASGLVADTRSTAARGFQELAAAQAEFRRDYQALLRAVLEEHKPTALCTIYDAVPDLPPAAVTGLSAFNDVILREAARHGLPVLDLRLLCDEARDYSELSPIEPSEIGGAKIVQGLCRVLLTHDFAQRQCVVYGAEIGAAR
jgi:lysophospholipase L1-like esterase